MNRHASLEIARPLFNGGVLLMPGTATFRFPSIPPGIALQKELEW